MQAMLFWLAPLRLPHDSRTVSQEKENVRYSRGSVVTREMTRKVHDDEQN
jgi:hypothetical protein